MDALGAGDIIAPSDGTFTGAGNRDVDFVGKALTVRSRSREPATGIIDCRDLRADPHRGSMFTSHEAAGAVLAGVTITHGWAAPCRATERYLARRTGAGSGFPGEAPVP